MIVMTHAEIRERFQSVGSVINSKYLTQNATDGLELDDMVTISTRNGSLKTAARTFFEGLPEQTDLIRAVTSQTSDTTQQAAFEGIVATLWHTRDYNVAVHVAEGALTLRNDISEIYVQLASLGAKYGKDFIYAITDTTLAINDNNYLMDMLHNVWTSIIEHDDKKEARLVLDLGKKIYEITERYEHVKSHRHMMTEFLGFIIEKGDYSLIEKLGEVFVKYSSFDEQVMDHLLERFELAFLLDKDTRDQDIKHKRDKKALYSKSFKKIFDSLLDEAVIDGIKWHAQDPESNVAKSLIDIASLSEDKISTHNAGVIANIYGMEAVNILDAIAYKLDKEFIKDRTLRDWTRSFLNQSVIEFVETRTEIGYRFSRELDTIESDVFLESVIGLVLNHGNQKEVFIALEAYSGLMQELDIRTAIHLNLTITDALNAYNDGTVLTDKQKRERISNILETYKQPEIAEFYSRIYNCRKNNVGKCNLADSLGELIINAESPETVIKALDITQRRGYYVLEYFGEIAKKALSHRLIRNVVELAHVCPRNQLREQLETITKRTRGLYSDGINRYVKQKISIYTK